MIARQTNPNGITAEGLRALRDRLGPAGMIEFFQAVRGGSGDYTRDRAKLFDGVNAREIAAAISGTAAFGSPSDWLTDFMEQAKRVARLPRRKQEFWLRTARAAFGTYPKIDDIMERLRAYMAAVTHLDAAKIREAHAEEFFEADAYGRFERIVSGACPLPADLNDAVALITYITIAGHLFPHLRKRLHEPDAQEYLLDQLIRLLRVAGRRRARSRRRGELGRAPTAHSRRRYRQ